jgi:hypothetical protein
VPAADRPRHPGPVPADRPRRAPRGADRRTVRPGRRRRTHHSREGARGHQPAHP